MKGAVAAAICGVAAAGKVTEFRKQIAVSASVMEEVLEGIALAHILDTYKPKSVVICEPSSLELMIAQRGRLEIVLTLYGKPAHASQPHLGDNPIEKAALAMHCLGDISYPKDSLLGNGVLVPVSILSDPLPSPSMIPFKTLVHFDRRTVPGETRESVFEGISNCLKENQINNFTLDCFSEPASTYTGITLCPERDFPPWIASAEAAECQAVLRALEASDLPKKLNVWTCCTNGSESAGRRGIPTVGLGPGDIRDAHIIDESIELSQLLKAVKVYKNLVIEIVQ
jgi:acetylornithine deacetylase/succinyl-diaminopimelate desuccinylase-like protein